MRKCIIRVLVLFSFFAFGQHKSALKITKLSGDFYVYETYKLYKNKPISANGMYLVTNDGVVMFDSPWDTSQALPLLDSIKKKHNKEVVMCIATHSHDDRTGSFGIYNKKESRLLQPNKRMKFVKLKTKRELLIYLKKIPFLKLDNIHLKHSILEKDIHRII